MKKKITKKETTTRRDSNRGSEFDSERSRGALRERRSAFHVRSVAGIHALSTNETFMVLRQLQAPLKNLPKFAKVISFHFSSRMAAAPKLKLNNHLEMPILGLGTWKSPKDAVRQAVLDAVNAGYRHLDCAYAYENEDEVGAAIHQLFSEGKVKREELFITSKLWNTFHTKERVAEGIKQTLKQLGLAFIDLYLIHWPVAFKESNELVPKDADDKILMSDADFVETWKAMEELVKQGLTRSIGLSNFNIDQMKRVLEVAEIKPANLQVECHPYLTQNDLFKFCKSHNIVMTAYSPLGSPDRMWAKPDDPLVITDPVVKAIGDKYGKSPAQVCIRYPIQRGIVVIPKSVTKSRIEENFKVFDFVLSNEDMKALDELNRDYRALAVAWMNHSKYFPW